MPLPPISCCFDSPTPTVPQYLGLPISALSPSFHGNPQRSAGAAAGPHPLQALLDSLDDEARADIDKRLTDANFPPLDRLSASAERQVRKWIYELAADVAKRAPFEDVS